MQELISIIVPIYNTEKYLSHCIESLIHQDYENIEILLIDDGSKDNSGTICDEYAKKDKRIKVIHQKNRGLSGARNTGIDASHGEYLAFVDSDDMVRTDFLSRLYYVMKSKECRLVVCDYQDFDEKEEEKNLHLTSKERSKNKDEVEISMFSQKEIYHLLNRNTNPLSLSFIVAWNKLYHKSLLDQVRFKEGKMHEDEFIVHHIYGQVDKVAWMKDRIYLYRQHTGSFMGSASFYGDLKHLTYLEAMEERIEFFKNKDRQMVSDAVRHFMDQSQIFYNEFSRKEEKEYRKAAKKIRKTFRKTYIENIRYMTAFEKIRCGIFAIHPLLYNKIRRGGKNHG